MPTVTNIHDILFYCFENIKKVVYHLPLSSQQIYKVGVIFIIDEEIEALTSKP